MKLTFLGATHEVTGSCFYLEACGKKMLIDYGMEQGANIFENAPLPVRESEIDMVFLTHAHIDHSGNLPLLSKRGFSGQIFATEGTQLLCNIMLQDCAHIQEQEAEWKNRKSKRAGREQAEPIYTLDDALQVMRCFVGVKYDTTVTVADGINIRFIDAGHLLGSSSIEINITEKGISKKLLFSGDIGNTMQPLLRDPTYPTSADYVVMESTYGTREHEIPVNGDYAARLAQVLQQTFDRGGNVVIPSFAVGRTQEMLFFIRQVKERKLVRGHDDFEVWVDSPLAIEATEVFYKRMFSDLDQEVDELLAKGINPIGFPGLRTAVSSGESRSINEDPNPKVIISASGMCEAGRIRHHLKHNLWRAECTILFVGYQAEGTLGRILVEGADKVKIFGEEIQVKAQILELPGVSGHADRTGLLKWIGSIREKPEKVFVVHGEDQTCMAFRDTLETEMGLDAFAPYSGTVFDLAEDKFDYIAAPIPIIRESDDARSKEEASGKAVSEDVLMENAAMFAKLQRAQKRLARLISECGDYAKGDLKKFTRELNDLCERWER